MPWKPPSKTVAAVGLATGNPNTASFPHILADAFKNLLAVAVETEYDIPQARAMKEDISASEP
jgi:large subunit ribosomal protein LP0